MLEMIHVCIRKGAFGTISFYAATMKVCAVLVFKVLARLPLSYSLMLD